MKVLKAEVLGFCMGVRRAVEMAEAELLNEAERLGSANPRPVYTMGPLIHNPQTLASLKERGALILDEGELAADSGLSLNGAAVIIRAHGISPLVEAELVKRGARIVDATCPRVRASQNTAQALSKNGYHIFLAGEKNHAEVKGIGGYIEGAFTIAGNAAEAEAAASALYLASPDAKTALIAQTTFSTDEYDAAAAAVQKYFPDVEVKNTICGATRERQEALKKLCVVAEALVVAGGRASANTRRLLDIAGESGKPAWLAESAGELPLEELRKYGTAGLCAGASTPDSVIAELEEKLLSL